MNPVTNTVDFTRVSSNGSKNPHLNPEQRESVIYRLHPEREGKRLIYQIGTASPALAVEACKLVAADVAGIDVNAGCPKPFSTSGGMGAALLQTPDILCSILEALVQEVGGPYEIGISVKIRLLETPELTRELVTRLCATGITGLTIHCRTTPMRPRERAIREQLRMITDICHEAGVACLMNGDVTTREEAIQLAEQYGADGGMIATAAEKNPSVFQAGDALPWEEVVHEYIKTALEVENRWGNTKYLLGQMIPGKAPQYRPMNQSKSYTELVKVMGLEEQLGILASDVDARLDLGHGMTRKETKADKKAKRKAAAAATPTDDKTRKPAKGKAQAPKRTAEQAGLDAMPADMARSIALGTLPEQATVMAV